MGCIPATHHYRIKKVCEESVALILLPCSTTGSSRQVSLEFVNLDHKAKNNCILVTRRKAEEESLEMSLRNDRRSVAGSCLNSVDRNQQSLEVCHIQPYSTLLKCVSVPMCECAHV